MAHLRFGVKSARVNYGTGGLMGSAAPRLTLDLAYNRSPLETLDLSTGEKKEDLDFILNFTAPPVGGRPYLDKVEGEPSEAVGMCVYSPAWEGDFASSPATLFFEVYLAPDAHAELMSFAVTGRYPEQVTVEIPALTFGWHPDGSDLKLDTKAHPQTEIVNAGYTLRLSPPDSDADDFAEVVEPVQPLIEKLEPLMAEVRKIAQTQKWSFYLLFGLLAAVLWLKK